MTMARVVRLDLAGRMAVVIGAGAALVLVELDETAVAEVAAATGGRAVIANPTDPLTVDLLDPALEAVADNAGFQHVAPLHDFPADRFAELLTVQVEAAFRLARRVLPQMYHRVWVGS